MDLAGALAACTRLLANPVSHGESVGEVARALRIRQPRTFLRGFMAQYGLTLRCTALQALGRGSAAEPFDSGTELCPSLGAHFRVRNHQLAHE